VPTGRGALDTKGVPAAVIATVIAGRAMVLKSRLLTSLPPMFVSVGLPMSDMLTRLLTAVQGGGRKVRHGHLRRMTATDVC
jgi:hypothetical protein